MSDSPEVKLLQAGVSQVVVGPLVNVPLRLDFVVVRQTIYFVDEHGKVDVGIHFESSGHGEMQAPERLHVVVLVTNRGTMSKQPNLLTQDKGMNERTTDLGVNDKNQSSSSAEDHLAVERRVEEVHLAREVPDLEVDKGAAGDIVLVNLVGALQE